MLLDRIDYLCQLTNRGKRQGHTLEVRVSGGTSSLLKVSGCNVPESSVARLMHALLLAIEVRDAR